VCTEETDARRPANGSRWLDTGWLCAEPHQFPSIVEAKATPGVPVRRIVEVLENLADTGLGYVETVGHWQEFVGGTWRTITSRSATAKPTTFGRRYLQLVDAARG